MHIKVMNRPQAEEQSKLDFMTYKAIISISTPNDIEPALSTTNPSIIDILRLKFYDMEKYEWEHYNTPYSERFTTEKAISIFDFVVKNFDEAEEIWVHCDGGVSRSAAVAAAILKVFTGNDDEIFKNDSYFPNMMVYRICVDTFMEKLKTFTLPVKYKQYRSSVSYNFDKQCFWGTVKVKNKNIYFETKDFFEIEKELYQAIWNFENFGLIKNYG